MAEAGFANIDAPSEGGITQGVMELWQFPFVFADLWWSAFFNSLALHRHVLSLHHTDHEQLVVPDPFEADGESGLFA